MSTPSAAGLNILIADDDESVRDVLGFCLERDDHRFTPAPTADRALAEVQNGVFDMAFVDLRFGDVSGLDLIPQLLGHAPWMKIVLITAHASVETAVEAMRRGAHDYLTKPIQPKTVRIIVERMAAMRRLERQVEELKSEVDRAMPQPVLDSRNPAMRRIIELARRVAESDALVLIRGESGTGKGVLAREIHRASARSQAAFSVINCPSLSSELLQSELFGHVKGAFTGAVKTQAGKIDLTEGGTLFLDEIGDLPGAIQPKLLRFVQDREFERVGDPTPRRADVRIVSATNRNLEEAVREGDFREDLLYRLNVIELTVPPLRERPEDVEDLAHTFLRFFAHKYNRKGAEYSATAWDHIRSHSWPGNVRELQNAIERALILSTTREVPRELFPNAVPSTGIHPVAASPSAPVTESVPAVESASASESAPVSGAAPVSHSARDGESVSAAGHTASSQAPGASRGPTAPEAPPSPGSSSAPEWAPMGAGSTPTAGDRPGSEAPGGAVGEDPSLETVSLEEMERRHIARVLEAADSLEDAAETLGIAPSTLWRKRRKFGL